MIREQLIKDDKKKKSSELKEHEKKLYFEKKGHVLYIFHSISEREVWNRWQKTM